MQRLTDDDLKIRHSTIHVLMAALGFVTDDASCGTIWQVQSRIQKAVDEGRLIKLGTGEYQISREYFDGQRQKNMDQPRSAE
jgi:hypothetical protein